MDSPVNGYAQAVAPRALVTVVCESLRSGSDLFVDLGQYPLKLEVATRKVRGRATGTDDVRSDTYSVRLSGSLVPFTLTTATVNGAPKPWISNVLPGRAGSWNLAVRPTASSGLDNVDGTNNAVLSLARGAERHGFELESIELDAKFRTLVLKVVGTRDESDQQTWSFDSCSTEDAKR